VSRTRRSSWRHQTVPHGPTFAEPFSGNRITVGEAAKPQSREAARPWREAPPKFHGVRA
jgi:hypothetical protein